MDETRSSARTLGVEEEFLLVDDKGQLASLGPEVLDTADRGPGELQQELVRCQVEAASPVCRGAEELLAELRSLRRRLAESAGERGLRLLAVPTPVLAEPVPPPLSPSPRYQRMAEHFGAIASTSICGCHIHVAVPDAVTGVQISNHLRPWLPVLLALTANSPFADGVDTGYASWRHLLWARWPSASPPPRFDSPAQYEASVRALLASGAALDRKMVYWDIRLSDRQPTLEVRVCDVAATAHEAALTAALVRGLVHTAVGEVAAGRTGPELPLEVLRAHLWRAARDGLEGACVHPVEGGLVPVHTAVGHLLERVRPALKAFGDLDLVESVLGALHRTGGGAARQRVVFAEQSGLCDVVDHLAQATVDGLPGLR